ncbi:hypothetical protein HZA97_03945 [Candidatus Woesearchaeota archaeon]|nr:hypothetical protein [Candidatus Woesearchaeota archaeon]
MSLKEYLMKHEGFEEYLKQYSDSSDDSKKTLTKEIEETITGLEKSNRTAKLVKAGLTTLVLAGGTYLAKTLGLDHDYQNFPYVSSFLVGKVSTGITAIMTLHNYLMLSAMKSAMFKEQVHEVSNNAAKEILEEKFPNLAIQKPTEEKNGQ